VLIEARIVEATNTFSRDLGVKWGVSHTNDSGNLSTANIGLGGSFLLPPAGITNLTGTAGLGTGLTFGRIGIDSTILDLRISALESSGYGKIISTPRVTTMNGSKAVISQGTEIPYQTISDDGKASTSFKKAELSLTVTPEINPDNSIFLEILAKNDSRGADVPTGLGSAPAIDTKTADTKVLVRDGETTVIGGIFIEEKRTGEDGVPFLRRIPILGHLFKSTSKREDRRELLVFITPRILNK
jgi:type IV pilus assembly protein PilQ